MRTSRIELTTPGIMVAAQLKVDLDFSSVTLIRVRGNQAKITAIRGPWPAYITANRKREPKVGDRFPIFHAAQYSIESMLQGGLMASAETRLARQTDCDFRRLPGVTEWTAPLDYTTMYFYERA